MDRCEVETRLGFLLENLVLQGYVISPNSTFIDMGLDSLDKVELCMDIEDEFGIDMSDDVMPFLDTYEELVNYTNVLIKKQVK